MARFRLTVEYVGTRYSGWQIQKNARTVAGEITAVVRRVSERTDFELYGSGRTDAGVHALGQVAHLDLNTRLTPEELRTAINDGLPSDVHVVNAQGVPSRFHARHDAQARGYLYQISRRRTAFGKPFVWWIKDRLDERAMSDALKKLLGLHDFRAFTADDPDEKSTKVAIERALLRTEGDLILDQGGGLALPVEDDAARDWRAGGGGPRPHRRRPRLSSCSRPRRPFRRRSRRHPRACFSSGSSTAPSRATGPCIPWSPSPARRRVASDTARLHLRPRRHAGRQHGDPHRIVLTLHGAPRLAGARSR